MHKKLIKLKNNLIWYFLLKFKATKYLIQSIRLTEVLTEGFNPIESRRILLQCHQQEFISKLPLLTLKTVFISKIGRYLLVKITFSNSNLAVLLDNLFINTCKILIINQRKFAISITIVLFY